VNRRSTDGQSQREAQVGLRKCQSAKQKLISKTKTQKHKNIMKNYSLIEWLWKTDSHEKQTPQRFGRYAVMLLMLLTLGVGQMWASMGFEDSNNGILFSRTPLGGSKADYRVEHGRTNSTQDAGNVSALTMKEWYAKLYQNEDNIWGDGHMYYRIYLKDSSAPGFTTSNKSYYNWNSWNSGWRYPTFGNNSLSVNVLSGLASGIYYFEYYFDATATSTLYCSNNSSNFKVKFTIKPNALTSFSVSRSGYSAGSGTSDDPYIIARGGSLTLTASGSGGTSDANSSIKYKYGSDDWTTSSKTISNITSTTRQSIIVKGARRHNSQDLGSDESSVTIYYKAETTYSVSISSGSPSSVQAGANYTTPTITASNVTGYHFDHWSISGNANVASTTTSPTTVTATSTGATITANYEPNTYTITLDDNGSYQGDGSATATYDNGTLTDFSHASRTGWSPSGYYTGASDGTMVIDAGGNLVASVAGYTDASGNWTRAADTKLYARWVQAYAVLYNANGGTGTTTDASSPYAPGADVTVLGNSFSRTGYTFTGWNTAYDGSGDPYAAGATIEAIDANVTLYAQWTENLTTVTVGVNPSNSGTLTLDASAFTPGNTTTAGVTTSHTVVTTAQPGYKFSSWGTTGNATGTSSTNTYTLKGNGSGSTGSLTANFSRLYAYVQGRFQVKDAARSTTTTTYGSGGQWSDESTNIQMDYDNTNHRFILHTHMTPSELTANHGTGCQDCKPYFFIKTSTSNSSLAGVTSYKCTASGATLVSTGSANGATVSSSGSNTLRFNSSTTSGYAVVYFDQSKIWYELEYRLQYNANGGSGTAPTGANGNNSYHATSTTAATNTFTARAYYTFGGWNTAQYITGTNYAAGASVPMTANTTLYAKWTRSVTLNQEDATTTGSTSVTGTYNCATLPAITNPKKTGYEFGGWYTETAGNGNLVINTSGQLQASKYHWTDASGRFDRTTEKADADLYAKWTQTVTLNANTGNHGSGSNTTATIVYKATAKSSITHCTPATGYHLEGYYTAATDGVKVLNADGSFASSAVTDYITDGKWTKAGATTLYAHYEPNTYDVILDVNGATTGSNQTVTATFDADMPTTQKGGSTPISAPSKTGYTFGGYYANNTGTGTQYYTNALASNHIWDVATNNTHIYAKWTANPYTVTLDVEEDNHGTIASATTSQSVTYDGATTTVLNRPTAANGYALDGYYTDQLGEGTKVINGDGTWIASVAGYTDGDAKWVHVGDVTLYAYYKKAEITNLVAAPGVIAPGETITITPTIEPTPTGTTKVCYELQYSNGTPLPSPPTFTPGAGNAVSFPVPSASATYIIQAKLAKGSTCPADPGDVLSTRTTTFQVAGEHDVTVKYMCGDLTIKASEVLGEIRPLTWSDDITAPTITGYTFARWDAGDGVTIKDGSGEDKTTSTSSTIKIKAVYDGTLTAVYTKKRLIFFNNTLGWSNVYVYFYKNDSYWEDSGKNRGSGSKTTSTWTDTPYELGKHGQMQPVSEGSNIYYFDAEAEGVPSSYDDVVFTEGSQHNYEFFYQTKAVRRGDYNSTQLPMFVPLKDQTPEIHNETGYTNSGYWMNYPENTGYSLLIYNQKTKAGATKLYEIPFEFTEDFTMPMDLVVDLEAGQTYGFEIKRADGTYYSNTGTMTANTTNWSMSQKQSSYCGLQTTAAGDYKFSLYYSSSNFKMDITYPVAVNDYRIVYTDLATWSKDAHTASWSHPSRVITKNSSATETKKDTVSFFWTYGSTPAIKYQTCTAVAAGSASWSAGTAIDVSGFSSVLTKKGVYNFIFEQPAGGASISLVKVEPYTGKYYIRTDCAGSTKWANFRSLDHQMTYSDYAEVNSGYSHYYTHWVTSGTNVKFCIANDYSQCITDTLVEDKGTVVADITTEGNANAGRLNSGDASIRFMWDYKTNKVSRAYISGSTNVSDRFLVLEGDAKMYDENGDVLSISGLNANEINLVDDQNFVYERTIKVNTGARAKLTAKYNNNVQYFRGSEGAFADGTTVQLLGGAASGQHTMRIVYDFKTNRLVTAYVPSGTIESDIAINADLMIVREHQDAGQQLLFNGGSLSEVKTVYGVMRFNRWTLNNKEKTGGHSPVGDPKSAYERALYWISFPFDVNLSDVFGFGTYGTHWIIMEYDGAERAKEGYWRDSEGFWKHVTNRTDKVLKAGKGYVLGLDLDLMKDDNTSFWSHNIEQVELFFPSAAVVSNISSTNVTTSVEEHECKIDRTGNNGSDINKNRTRADSHWNIIGIPSYANYGTTLEDGSGNTINWHTSPYTNDLPFLYEWSPVDNTYSVQSGTTYPFKSMHAYMVQYHGDLYWSMASATPVSPIVARRTYAEAPQNVEMRLELSQNEQKADQTFVKLSNDENVSANFAFDEDLCKEYNANKANIYTIVENYLPVAGNTLPMSDQTTIVPVGVKIAATGDYTFAIPDGTSGVGVTLVDTETGIRTSLSALDYTVNLAAGTYDNRFLLEISPIVQTPTGVEEVTGDGLQVTGARKVIIDQKMYIIKDGKIYDAQGRQVK
jgi:uncharacterized repeat protein (TIGR02543 family)